MYFNKPTAALALLFVALISCNGPANDTNKKQIPATAMAGFDNIIPKPVYTKAAEGAFQLTATSSIIVENVSGEVFAIGQYLSDKLKTATGFELKVTAATEKQLHGNIYLKIAADSLNNNEAYTLNVTEDSVVLSSPNAAGLFRGVQSLRQLFLPAIESATLQKTDWYIASGTIKDYPLYAYRGTMLDVARHFFSVEDVKHYIDLLAYYKMNVMHLHLSDDQGWRIEIKAWPKLTSYGGSTQVGGGKAGFYTQEQYKDIVAYAGNRYITVIPEIDMPGHTNAALASYPELNCNPKDKNPKLYTGTEVGFSTLCTQNENVYKFVDDVIAELAAITPGPYIHIGGDESHVTATKDYIKFIDRVQGIVVKHGKQVIGWDEIGLSTSLQPNTIAQYWADSANSVNAVKKGAKIIISPAKKTYLDMKYDSATILGLNWAGYIEVDTGYIWDPATMVKGISRENIIGIEAPLWTETITKMAELEFMVFPRLPGYAEIGWSPAAGRSWDEYKIRLGKHGSTMKAMGINFYKSKKVPWVE
jgi:hexosaminidase